MKTWHEARRGACAVLLAGACLWLAGCAVITEPPHVAPGIDDMSAWHAHRERVAALDQWSIQGRVASGQLLGWTGNLSWRQRGARFDVRLSGPLGAGGFYAFGTLDQVTINTGERHFVTSHPQRLVRRILGWQFPLRPLRYWAKGCRRRAITAASASMTRGIWCRCIKTAGRLRT